MNESDTSSAKEWYVRNQMLYERLGDGVRATLVSAITHANIPFLTVATRTKTMESFLEKISRKGYRDPQNEMTDLAGIRIIAYIESDVNRICDLVRSSFKVHSDKSPDKAAELGKDKFGYRSMHFICELGEHRLTLSENTPYKNRVFEIQVRTVLEHAWAEIGHDRGYKFSSKLPADLERRLYAQAAILESVDREFNHLADELDKYATTVKAQVVSGELSARIDATSLSSYTSAQLVRIPRIKFPIEPSPLSVDLVVKQLTSLGVLTLADLDGYFSDEFLQRYEQDNSNETQHSYVSMIRQALLYGDPKRFYEKTGEDVKNVSMVTFRMLVDKHGFHYIKALFMKHGIKVRTGQTNMTADELFQFFQGMTP